MEVPLQRLIDLGDGRAILTYTGRGYRDDDEPAFVGIMSSVYIRQDGAWRLAFYQQTPVPDPQ